MNKYNLNLFFISNSPWPLILSINLLLLVMNLVWNLNSKLNLLLMMMIFNIMVIMFMWWNDVIIESTYQGFHNYYIMHMTIFSMIMFIISEIFFFLSFFWTFFHFLFSPDIMIGGNWPCSGILMINFMNLPLLNSILLLSSGCFVTWSHWSLINNKINISKKTLFFTVIFGFLFISCQLFEYLMSTFSFSDSSFGSIFFIATGFHGIHVMIGSLFLLIMLIRMSFINFSKTHMMGYEFSIWYWHFVDLVWLYLYLMVYWLGG